MNIVSENKPTMLRFDDACVEKGRVVFVDVVWFFFSSLSMNQQRLYRRLIIAKRLSRIFLLYSSPLFDRLIFAQPRTTLLLQHILIHTHTHHRPTVITSTFPRSPTVSHRRCTTTSASKTS